MAIGTYISVNLNKDQQSLLKALSDYEIDIFTLQELELELGSIIGNINELVENLTHKGFLNRIERGKYCRANFHDDYVIGTRLVDGGAVAYWSALNLHNLTEQISNTVFIQSCHKKNPKHVFGVRYQFVQIESRKQAGIIMQGHGNHIYAITDREKTIIDCFDHPAYSGGYDILLQIFMEQDLDEHKLIKYASLINNRSVIKRMGYLAELYEKENMDQFIKFAYQQVNTKYTLLDPTAQDEGKFISAWKLRLNINKDQLLISNYY